MRLGSGLTNGCFADSHHSMARKPRIHFPGAVYHVMLRGNGGRDIFFSAADRTKMFFLLQEGVERYGHCIHAFCLMSNHVHLVMQVGEIPLSKIIQNLSFRYTRYVNAIKEESGHLFQGRYKAILIDADSYLLQLVRYIHNNPIRAHIASHCADFPWSSHRAYCGDACIPWLTVDWVLKLFSGDSGTARKLYNDFMCQGETEGRRQEFHCGSTEGRVLGDDVFVEQVLVKTEERFQRRNTLEQIVEAVCAVYEIPLSVLSEPGRRRNVSEARAVAAFFVLASGNLVLADLALVLRRELSGLSQASGRLRKRLPEDERSAGQLEKVRMMLDEMPICQA
jgi:putative transposase